MEHPWWLLLFFKFYKFINYFLVKGEIFDPGNTQP